MTIARISRLSFLLLLAALPVLSSCTTDQYGNTAVTPGGAVAIGAGAAVAGAAVAGAAIGAALKDKDDRKHKNWHHHHSPPRPPHHHYRPPYRPNPHAR